MTTRIKRRAHVVYITHNGLTEPLGRRQVLPYVVGLASRGWHFTILSFEKQTTATPDAIATVKSIVDRSGICWVPLRYHRTPPLLATGLDLLRGALVLSRLGWGAQLVHARSTVPALMSQLVAPTVGARWIFDVRGLVADEYAEMIAIRIPRLVLTFVLLV